MLSLFLGYFIFLPEFTTPSPTPPRSYQNSILGTSPWSGSNPCCKQPIHSHWCSIVSQTTISKWIGCFRAYLIGVRPWSASRAGDPKHSHCFLCLLLRLFLAGDLHYADSTPPLCLSISRWLLFVCLSGDDLLTSALVGAIWISSPHDKWRGRRMSLRWVSTRDHRFCQ